MGSTQADVQALVQLMQHMNVEPEELLAAARVQELPTFEQFMPLVRDAAPPASQVVYRAYWKKIVACWGTRRLDEPTAREVGDLIEEVRANAQRRRNYGDGSGAACHTYYALRRVYQLAVDEGLLSSRRNPMARVTKPRQAKSRRYALSPQLYREIVQVAAGTGLDPRLDSLLLRFHLETAARTGGALNLRLGDLDPERLLIVLREKNSVTRKQPVSRALMQALLDHAEERGVRDKESPLLRFPDGRPMTKIRYRRLWDRVQMHIKVVDEESISTHWLRHTTLTWVERNWARKPSGTGSNCLIRRPPGASAATRICWSARWRIPAAGAVS
ncbi:site-specific integrase [Lentzea sp. NPDC005914]|uniref:tyrosine-type recombinase/integrase n=1 Tax=Lentzea sp. NPDC005914 TaxID=3154572 RepID=UPI0033D1F757